MSEQSEGSEESGIRKAKKAHTSTPIIKNKNTNTRKDDQSFKVNTAFVASDTRPRGRRSTLVDKYINKSD